MFHGLAGRRTLDGFLGASLVLQDGLPLTERLVLEMECLGHFRWLLAGFVLVCPKRVFLVLKFVRLRVKNVVEGLLVFVSDFAEKCR
jgi:hypothetical protein